MITFIHLAILWVGSRFVHEKERAEWLVEWQTELWYAMQEGCVQEVTMFCVGAWRDAVWKRRNAVTSGRGSVLMIWERKNFPTPPAIDWPHPLESPFRCLAFLGLLALVAVAASLLSPGPLLAGGKVPFRILPFCVIIWPVVALTSGTGGGNYPRHCKWLRRSCFYIGKLTFLFLIVTFGASDVTRSPGRINIAFAGAFAAIRWAIMDQRRRCPNCLRLLDKPVRMGSGSRILLEWNGTELLCLRGHGVMHVPDSPAIWFSKPRWLSLG